MKSRLLVKTRPAVSSRAKWLGFSSNVLPGAATVAGQMPISETQLMLTTTSPLLNRPRAVSHAERTAMSALMSARSSIQRSLRATLKMDLSDPGIRYPKTTFLDVWNTTEIEFLEGSPPYNCIDWQVDELYHGHGNHLDHDIYLDHGKSL